MAWRSHTVQQSRWASPPVDSSASATAAAPPQRSGGGAAPNATRSDARTSTISRNGLRKARPHVGKQVNQLDLLLSPSRGLASTVDPAAPEQQLSLSDPEVQDRFRAHIQEKLRKWAAAPRRTHATAGATQRKEELGTILLDFRKLREGVTSSRRVDPFACEVYEASVLLSLYNENEPQLSSSLPHLVASVHPAASQSRSAATVTEPPDLAPAFNDLSLEPAATEHSPPPPDPARRAYFLVLHLLHSSLLPSQSVPSRTETVGSSSAGPTASSFLPTLASALAASRLEPFSASSVSPETSNPNPHIAFLLGLRLALEQNNYAALANDYLALDKLPPMPPSIHSHLEALHLSSPLHTPSSPSHSASSSLGTFDPLAHLLKSYIPRLRQHRIWPALQRAYRFPPDRTDWLGKMLLFEFEVEVERQEAGDHAQESAMGARSSRQSAVQDTWDAAEEDEEDRSSQRRRAIEEEAARRAAAWVAERTSK